jgi:hypothetical protein
MKYHIYVMGILHSIFINGLGTINGMSPSEKRGDDIVRDEDGKIIFWTPQFKSSLNPVTVKLHKPRN